MIPIGTVCVFRSVVYPGHPENGHVCEVVAHEVHQESGTMAAIVNPPLTKTALVDNVGGEFLGWGSATIKLYISFSSLTPLYQGDANTVVGWSDCLWKPEDLKCT